MSEGRTTSDARKDKMQKDPRAFLQLAEEHRRTGRLKEAIAVCLEGLGLHPNLDAARITLGRSYLEDSQFADARAVLEEVFTRQPEHHLAGKLLADAQRRMGDLEGAVATCRTVLAHYPRDRDFEALLAGLLAEAEAPPVSASETPAGAESRTARPEEAADPGLDYTPEDVEIGPATPAPVSAQRQAAIKPPAPVPARTAGAVAATTKQGSTSGEAAAVRGDAFQTNTLAELYARQGLIDRAISVYRGMLRVDPANEKARLRLAQLEAKGTAGRPDLPAPAPAPNVAGPAATPRADAGGPEEARRQAIARLERWLDDITEGSADAAGGRGGTGA
jgi:tetratricopeptide (TPR) repeat protein